MYVPYQAYELHMKDKDPIKKPVILFILFFIVPVHILYMNVYIMCTCTYMYVMLECMSCHVCQVLHTFIIYTCICTGNWYF